MSYEHGYFSAVQPGTYSRNLLQDPAGMDEYVYPSEWPPTQRQQGVVYEDQQGGQEAGTHSRSGVPVEPSDPSGSNLWFNPSNVGASGTSFYNQATAFPQSVGTIPMSSTIPYNDGFILPVSNDHNPRRALRIVSGGSIIELDSVLDEENGMTYQNHPTARYLFPNDPEEQDRQDLQHKVFKMYLGGALHRAPVGSARNVLEIATGTGIWAIQYATEHRQHHALPLHPPPFLSLLGVLESFTVHNLWHCSR